MTTSSKPNAESTMENRPGLVLTAVGPDRPGLVKELAGHVRKFGGNIEDTRMARLGGEFAVLVLVTGEESGLADLKGSLAQLETALGIACFCKNTSTQLPKDGTMYQFRASGVDHPGIVESVTSAFASRSINVVSLSSRIENAPLTGTPLFILDAQVELGSSVNYQDLVSGLTDACERENLEFTIEKSSISARPS